MSVQPRVPGAELSVRATVEAIIDDVRERGDEAVREASERPDGWSPESFRLSPDDVLAIVDQVPAEVIRDIEFCQRQVRRFAEAQRQAVSAVEGETVEGVILGHKNIPVSSVGAYVPGGRYPMVASAHMSVVTAKVAGVPRVAAATPPMNGAPPAATIAAMVFAGADEIYVMGGVQAVAAMALGTHTISAVDMLVGPGNAY